MPKSFAGFMSYVRLDDQHENGRLSEFRSRLSSEVQMQLGEEFSIFQDRNDIAWGQQWQARVDGAIDATTFLIPVITPAFFKSPACRSEVERFLEREKKLGRSDLILPVYYVNCAVFSESLRASDEIAAIIAARQYADWRELRFEPFTTPIVGKTLATLAGQIVRAIELLEPAASLETKTVLPKGGNDPPAELGESEDDSKQVFVSAVQRVAAGAKDPPTIIVDAFHRGDFPTLTEAITAAQPGHRILVRSGLYREALVNEQSKCRCFDCERCRVGGPSQHNSKK